MKRFLQLVTLIAITLSALGAEVTPAASMLSSAKISGEKVELEIPLYTTAQIEDYRGSIGAIGRVQGLSLAIGHIFINGEEVRLDGVTYCNRGFSCLTVKDLSEKGGSNFSSGNIVLDYPLKDGSALYITLRNKVDQDASESIYLSVKKDGKFSKVQQLDYEIQD